MIMKLFEIALPKLYHGSRKSFPIGFVLRPQSDGYTSFQDEDVRRTEGIIEKYRPQGLIPRTKSVFMVDDPTMIESAGGYEDFVYLVRPNGRVERSNLGWYSRIDAYVDATEQELAEWSNNYWAGVPYDKRPSVFEYRAESAQIIEIIGRR